MGLPFWLAYAVLTPILTPPYAMAYAGFLCLRCCLRVAYANLPRAYAGDFSSICKVQRVPHFWSMTMLKHCTVCTFANRVHVRNPNTARLRAAGAGPGRVRDGSGTGPGRERDRSGAGPGLVRGRSVMGP